MTKATLTISVELELITRLEEIAKEQKTNRSVVASEVLNLWISGNLTAIKEVKCFKCGAKYINKVGNCPVCTKEEMKNDKPV